MLSDIATVNSFQRGLILFFEKWDVNPSAPIRAAIAHFQRSWTNNSTSRWARCHLNRCTVINNNGLESTNNVIKIFVTRRLLLPVLDFIPECLDWVHSQSRLRNPSDPNFRQFADTVEISNSLYELTYDYRRLSTKQIRIRGDVYVSTESCYKDVLTDVSADKLIDEFQTFSFTSFDRYAATTNAVSIQRPDPTRTEKYWCTCVKNAKEFKCKHSVAVAVLRGTLAAPPGARVNVLGVANKRGRKPFIPPAYARLPFYYAPRPQYPVQDPALLAGVPIPVLPEVAEGEVAEGEVAEGEEDMQPGADFPYEAEEAENHNAEERHQDEDEEEEEEEEEDEEEYEDEEDDYDEDRDYDEDEVEYFL